MIRCEEHGCYTRANFGYPGGPVMRCGTHRLEGMVGTAAAVMHRDPWAATLWLRQAHAASRMLYHCLSAGGRQKPQMRRRWVL